MKRRTFLLGGGSLLAAGQVFCAKASSVASMASMKRYGHLVIIGGAEDRTGDKLILRRFIQLIEREKPRIAVLSAASGAPQISWERYQRAFDDLGVRHMDHIAISRSEDGNDPALAERIMQADGLLLTGGDQRRLMSLIGGTLLESLILYAHRKQGMSVAGTSAGASAMSRYMLVGRSVSGGLGLVPNAVIDQHFSQRRRLSRLVRAVAGKPEVIGIGVDEDTALILAPNGGIEVLGEGDVTFVDGRRLPATDGDVDPDALLHMPQMQLMRLMTGTYRHAADDGMRDIFSLLSV